MLPNILLLALTGLCSASPTGFGTSSSLQSREIHQKELHARTLANHPKDLIIESGDLDDYIRKHPDSDGVLYLKDKQTFVPMSTVTALEEDSQDKDGKSKRQYTSPCYVYDEWEARDPESWWGAWETASGCLYTGLSDGSGTRTISWSKSVSVEISGGLDWNPIKEVLGVSLGVSVTNTWTDGGKVDCNIPAGSVGQIWAQKYMGQANMWRRMCQSCGASGQMCIGDWEEAGSVTAPSDGSDPSKNVNVGCSTGSKNVQC